MQLLKSDNKLSLISVSDELFFHIRYIHVDSLTVENAKEIELRLNYSFIRKEGTDEINHDLYDQVYLILRVSYPIMSVLDAHLMGFLSGKADDNGLVINQLYLNEMNNVNMIELRSHILQLFTEQFRDNFNNITMDLELLPEKEGANAY